MNFLTVPVQMIAAFLIFVVGYSVLLLSAVICFVTATCVYRSGSLAWAYTAKSASLDHSAVRQVKGDADSAPRLVAR